MKVLQPSASVKHISSQENVGSSQTTHLSKPIQYHSRRASLPNQIIQQKPEPEAVLQMLKISNQELQKKILSAHNKLSSSNQTYASQEKQNKDQQNEHGQNQESFRQLLSKIENIITHINDDEQENTQNQQLQVKEQQERSYSPQFKWVQAQNPSLVTAQNEKPTSLRNELAMLQNKNYNNLKKRVLSNNSRSPVFEKLRTQARSLEKVNGGSYTLHYMMKKSLEQSNSQRRLNSIENKSANLPSSIVQQQHQSQSPIYIQGVQLGARSQSVVNISQPKFIQNSSFIHSPMIQSASSMPKLISRTQVHSPKVPFKANRIIEQKNPRYIIKQKMQTELSSANKGGQIKSLIGKSKTPKKRSQSKASQSRSKSKEQVCRSTSNKNKQLIKQQSNSKTRTNSQLADPCSIKYLTSNPSKLNINRIKQKLVKYGKISNKPAKRPKSKEKQLLMKNQLPIFLGARKLSYQGLEEAFRMRQEQQTTNNRVECCKCDQCQVSNKENCLNSREWNAEEFDSQCSLCQQELHHQQQQQIKENDILLKQQTQRKQEFTLSGNKGELRKEICSHRLQPGITAKFIQLLNPPTTLSRQNECMIRNSNSQSVSTTTEAVSHAASVRNKPLVEKNCCFSTQREQKVLTGKTSRTERPSLTQREKEIDRKSPSPSIQSALVAHRGNYGNGTTTQRGDQNNNSLRDTVSAIGTVRSQEAKDRVSNSQKRRGSTKSLLIKNAAPSMSQFMNQPGANSNTWIDGESFACKSMEIINTHTVVSRNNTHFEVHQYKKEETTLKENQIISEERISEPVISNSTSFVTGLEEEFKNEGYGKEETGRSSKIRNVVSDYLALKEGSKRSERNTEAYTAQVIGQNSKNSTIINRMTKRSIDQQSSNSQAFDAKDAKNNYYYIQPPHIELPSLSSFTNNMSHHNQHQGLLSFDTGSLSDDSLISLQPYSGVLLLENSNIGQNKHIYDCYGIIKNQSFSDKKSELSNKSSSENQIKEKISKRNLNDSYLQNESYLEKRNSFCSGSRSISKSIKDVADETAMIDASLMQNLISDQSNVNYDKNEQSEEEEEGENDLPVSGLTQKFNNISISLDNKADEESYYSNQKQSVNEAFQRGAPKKKPMPQRRFIKLM